MLPMRLGRAVEDAFVKLSRDFLQQLVLRGAEVFRKGEELARRQLLLFKPLAVTLGHVLGGFAEADGGFVEIVAVQVVFGFLQLGLFDPAVDCGCGVTDESDE